MLWSWRSTGKADWRFKGKLRSDLLAFDEDLHLTVKDEGVIDFFAFLDADVGGEFGYDFRGVEHVIAEYLTYERHDERRLGRFLRLD